MESKIILTFDKKDLYERFTYRVMEVQNNLCRDLLFHKPLNVKSYLDLYNAYQESERDGVDYIFDLENKDDVAVLLSNCEDMKEFHKLINSGQRYCLSGVNYPQPKFLNDNGIFDEVRYCATDLAAWMLCFPQCCPKSVVDKYISPLNDLYTIIFPKCDMWDWWYQENYIGSIRVKNEVIKIEL